MQEWSVQGSWFAAALAVLGSWTTPARATISMFTRVPSIDDLTFGNYRICDRLSLLLVVQSTSAVQSVRGRIDTFEFDLTQDSGNEWTASMDIPPLAYGMHPLVITATNADGEQAVFSREFMCDRAPVVHVAAPVAGLATTGPVTIEASCTDDGPDGCAGLKVVYSASSQLGQSAEFANLVACGTDRISGTYDLSRFAGMSAALHFIAYEANGTLRGSPRCPRR